MASERTETDPAAEVMDIVVLEDDIQDYTYPVDTDAVIDEVTLAHCVDREEAIEMLRKSSMEHPVRGWNCKFWRE